MVSFIFSIFQKLNNVTIMIFYFIKFIFFIYL
jgi:hypothetical protein